MKSIEDALARHGSGVISVSGGKDSITVMHLARQWADRLTLVFCDMGDMFPHVRPYVERLADLWDYKLHVVESKPPRYSLPSDIVPAWSTPFADWFLPEESKPETMIISGIDCCNVTLWQPLDAAIKELGASLVIRGSKGTDEHISVSSGTVMEGIEYLNPLEDWTDEKVYWYLQDHAIELPMQYQVGVNHSLDCMRCTAWLSTPAEVQRIEFTKRYYPAAFKELQERMRLVLAETQRRSGELAPAINAMFQTAGTSHTPAE
jgi:phosphoadenosine phosphosulfate reductase